METVLTTHFADEQYRRVDRYLELGGYEALRKALSTPKEQIVEEVKKANLRGAGAYICGEETSLLNSLEGKRGWPRIKPPFPASVGAFGLPTIVNNVETIADIPWIVTHGGEKFASLGVEKDGGTRLVCVSGPVKKPGVYELPVGISLRSILYEHAGGMQDGKALKAVIPGG